MVYYGRGIQGFKEARMAEKKVGMGGRETKSENLLVRVYPATKRHLEEVSDRTGYTMSSLVEHAVLGLSVAQFPDAPGLREEGADGQGSV